jgi:5-methylcytosine-specific restriction endonuclease McrA
MQASRRCNGPDRGNAQSRRNRKLRLLSLFGDGKRCHCVYCNRWLTFKTLTVDRIVPGADGGSYQFENCLPACITCNARRGDNIHWKSPRWYGRKNWSLVEVTA